MCAPMPISPYADTSLSSLLRSGRPLRPLPDVEQTASSVALRVLPGHALHTSDANRTRAHLSATSHRHPCRTTQFRRIIAYRAIITWQWLEAGELGAPRCPLEPDAASADWPRQPRAAAHDAAARGGQGGGRCGRRCQRPYAGIDDAVCRRFGVHDYHDNRICMAGHGVSSLPHSSTHTRIHSYIQTSNILTHWSSSLASPG